MKEQQNLKKQDLKPRKKRLTEREITRLIAVAQDIDERKGTGPLVQIQVERVIETLLTAYRWYPIHRKE